MDFGGHRVRVFFRFRGWGGALTLHLNTKFIYMIIVIITVIMMLHTAPELFIHSDILYVCVCVCVRSFEIFIQAPNQNVTHGNFLPMHSPDLLSSFLSPVLTQTCIFQILEGSHFAPVTHFKCISD